MGTRYTAYTPWHRVGSSGILEWETILTWFSALLVAHASALPRVEGDSGHSGVGQAARGRLVGVAGGVARRVGLPTQPEAQDTMSKVGFT